jgi:dihydrofolate reductase
MRQLTVNAFVTLDGVMQAPGGPNEDPSGGFAHGGWSVNYWDDVMNEVMGAALGEPFDLLLGRRTYEIFAAHWPNVSEVRAERGGDASAVEDPAGAALNEATKYVASRTLDKLEWQNSVLLEGDLTDAVAGVKAQDGPDIQIHGSANLIQSLLPHNLIDQFRVWTFPLMVGPGKRLFDGGTVPTGLRLVDSKTSTTGVVIATYEPAGVISYGNFDFEEPTEAELARRRKLAAEG